VQSHVLLVQVLRMCHVDAFVLSLREAYKAPASDRDGAQRAMMDPGTPIRVLDMSRCLHYARLPIIRSSEKVEQLHLLFVQVLGCVLLI